MSNSFEEVLFSAPGGGERGLLTVKLVTLFVLLFGSLISCFAPIILSQWKWLHAKVTFMDKILKIMRLLEGFAGGILLGGGMLHLIPEASEKMSGAISELIHHHHNTTMSAGGQWMTQFSSNMGRSSKFRSTSGGLLGDEGDEGPWFVEYPWVATLACCALLTIYFLENILMKFVVHAKTRGEMDVAITAEESMLNASEHATNYGSDDQQLNKHHHDHHHGKMSKTSLTLFLNAIVIWISLSVHSVFEGLGLGAADDVGEMWSLFAAIMAHKFVAAFALGIIIEQGFRKIDPSKFWRNTAGTIFLVISFAIATPVGIAIGIGITESGASSENNGWLVAESCLLALAAGAFLHVSLFEVLGSHNHSHGPDDEDHEEEPHPIYSLVKFILFIIGFAVMAILAPFT